MSSRHEATGTARKWRRVIGWIAAGLAPLVVVVIATWGLWNPTARASQVSAAIVNQDQPVRVGGQITPMGRQLAAVLMGDDIDGNFAWQITQPADARDGLRSGDYAAVVTIPKDFSKAATSAGTDPEAVTQARIDVQVRPGASQYQAEIAARLAQDAAAVLGRQVTNTYLDNVYVGLSTMHDQTVKAADGASDLASGSGALASGMKRFASGVDQADSGARDAASGSRTLSGATEQLADGTGRLADGAGALGTGATALAAGSRQVASGAGSLATGVRRYTQGVDQLAQGVDTLHGKTGELQSGVTRLSGGVDQYTGAVDSAIGPIDDALKQFDPDAIESGCRAKIDQTIEGVYDLVTQYVPDLPVTREEFREKVRPIMVQGCAALGDAAQQLEKPASDAEKQLAALLQGGKDLRSGAGSLQRSVGTTSDTASDGTLIGALNDIDAGAQALSKNSGELRSGGEDLAGGASRLDRGIQQLVAQVPGLISGVNQLNSGAQQVADGSGTLTVGLDQLAQGTRTLSANAGKLTDGSASVSSGSTQLADGLKKAKGQIPNYSKSERNRLADVVSKPVASNTGAGSVWSPSRGLALYAVAALWLGALAGTFLTRAVPRWAFGTTRPAIASTLAGLAPRAALGAVQGLAVGLVAAGVAEVPGGRWMALAACGTLIGASFAAVHHGMEAWMGRWSKLVSMLVLALIAVAGIATAAPQTLVGIAGAMPTAPAMQIVNVLAAGTGASVGGSIAAVVAWGAAGVLAAELAVTQSRTADLTRVRERLSAPPSPATH